MDYLQALFLGALQGVAEFLPISSSGHLIVFRGLLGLGDVPVLFDVLLHLATLVAVCIVFRERLGGILASLGRWCTKRNKAGDAENLAIVPPAIVATALTGVIGYFVNKVELEGSPKIVALLLGLTALILIASSFLKGRKGYKELSPLDGVLPGIAQGIGVFPGISRSGATISGCAATGMARKEAGEFAFLISIPAILGALALKLPEAGELGQTVSLGPLALACAVSLVVGIVSLKLLMKVVTAGKLKWFALYLLPAAALGFFFL
jgi:undecaprenyl-diphosphatase